MPGYWPSALGAATKVRIGEPGSAMSAYSVVTTICLCAKFWPRRESRSTSQFTRRLVVDRDQTLPLHSRAVPQGCQSLCSTAIVPLPSHLRYFPERQKWPDRRPPGTCAWLLADGTLQIDVSCGLLPFPSLVSPTNSRSTGSTRKSKKAGRQVVEANGSRRFAFLSASDS